LTKTN